MRTKSKRYHGTNRYLLGANGWPLRSYEILPLFGLKPSSPIPPDFTSSVTYNGVTLLCRAKTRRGMEKRVFAKCPECGAEIEAGHLHQHVEARHS